MHATHIAQIRPFDLDILGDNIIESTFLDLELA